MVCINGASCLVRANQIAATDRAGIEFKISLSSGHIWLLNKLGIAVRMLGVAADNGQFNYSCRSSGRGGSLLRLATSVAADD